MDGIDVIKLTGEFPATIPSFDMPGGLLEPGDYEVEIGAAAENGNITFVEQKFSMTEGLGTDKARGSSKN